MTEHCGNCKYRTAWERGPAGANFALYAKCSYPNPSNAPMFISGQKKRGPITFYIRFQRFPMLPSDGQRVVDCPWYELFTTGGSNV